MNAGQHSRWWAARATGLSVGELELVTRDYWDRNKPTPDATAAQRIQWYVKNLLPEELYYADEKRKALRDHPCHTLALLVGHSLFFQTARDTEPKARRKIITPVSLFLLGERP